MNKTNAKLEEKSIAEDQKTYLLKIREGHIKITLTRSYRGYDGQRYFRAADITLTTISIRSLERVFELSTQPYWYFAWLLKEDLDTLLSCLVFHN